MPKKKAEKSLEEMSLGEAIDAAYTKREERLAFQRKMDEQLSALKEKEKQVEDYIINKFSKGDIEGAKGSLATASINKLTVAQVEDWSAFFPWVGKNEAWDLIQKRVNDKAYRERLENNEKMPGVSPFVVIKLSLTKR